MASPGFSWLLLCRPSVCLYVPVQWRQQQKACHQTVQTCPASPLLTHSQGLSEKHHIDSSYLLTCTKCSFSMNNGFLGFLCAIHVNNISHCALLCLKVWQTLGNVHLNNGGNFYRNLRGDSCLHYPPSSARTA